MPQALDALFRPLQPSAIRTPASFVLHVRRCGLPDMASMALPGQFSMRVAIFRRQALAAPLHGKRLHRFKCKPSGDARALRAPMPIDHHLSGRVPAMPFCTRKQVTISGAHVRRRKTLPAAFQCNCLQPFQAISNDIALRRYDAPTIWTPFSSTNLMPACFPLVPLRATQAITFR